MNKIEYKTNTDGMNAYMKSFAFKFTITDSITKTHFKELMKITRFYDNKNRTGLISVNDADSFVALVEKINASKTNVARASHKKAVEKKKAQTTMTIQDYCEEVLDQDYSLLSVSGRAEAWASFRSQYNV